MVNLENPNWISNDLHTAQAQTISPHSEGLLHIFVPREVVQRLGSSQPHYYDIATRSRVAQVGLEVGPKSTSMALIVQTLKPHGRKYKKGQLMCAQIDAMNNSERVINIPGGTSLFRLLQKGQQSLKGKQLIEALQNGKITISGDYMKDWRFEYKNGSQKEQHIKGIIFRIDPASHRWILPSPDYTAINLGEIANLKSRYRDYIDQLLVPIPVSNQGILTISETSSSLRLSGTHALIYPLVRLVTGEYGTSHHINSLFVQDGSDWRIRTEILGPTTPKNIAGEIAMQFWNAT